MEKNHKFKVTQVSKYYYPFIGGLEVVADQIARVLKMKGYEADVIASAESLKSSSEIVNKIALKRCGRLFEFKSNPVSIRLIQELSKVKTDVLHYHHPYIFAAIAHFIARPKYKYLTATYHGDITRQRFIVKLFNPIYEAFLNRVDKIHVLAPNMIENSITLCKVKDYKNKCVVIPFGIDVSFFETVNHNQMIKIKETYKDKKILLFVGRISHMKGLEYLIRAMPQVSEEAILLIAGKGELQDYLQAIVAEKGLQKRVFFLGLMQKEKLVSYFQACDLFVLPSVSEPFGIVQLEAMVCKKPVVNTWLNTAINFGSIDQETGLTVEPKNPDALAKAINTLLADDELRKTYGENAKKRVLNHFSLEKIQQEYINFYQQLFNQPEDQ